MADAAWEAITYHSYVYRHRLTGSIYGLFPRRRRGHDNLTLAPLLAEVLRRDMTYSQDMNLNLSGRLQSALGEIHALEERLQDTEVTLRARMRVQQGEDSDLYSSGICTWTATSLDCGHPEYQIVESYPTGRTPPQSSPSDEGSRS